MRRALRFLPLALVMGWISWHFVPRRLPHPDAFDAMPVPVAVDVEGENADAILGLLQEAYTNTQGYRDEGWVQCVRIEGNDRKLDSVEHFRVALVRPDHLAWQWQETMAYRGRENRFVDLLQSGKEVRFESGDWGKLTLRARDEALAKIAAWDYRDLLQLLFPGEMGGRALLERLAETRVAGIEQVDGHDCFRIEGIWPVQDSEPATYVLWVDRESHHLRRLVERRPIAEWVRENTEVFSPDSSGEVSAAELALDDNF